MKQRCFITGDGRIVNLPTGHSARIGAGGQGQVFRIQLGADPIAVKLRRQLDWRRLSALQRLGSSCGNAATLPRHLLYHCHDGQRGALAGYGMRFVDSKNSVSAARLFNFEEIAILQSFSWRDAVLAALRLAESVATLHGNGVVIGDLNPENVLFEQQGNKRGPSTWRAVLLDSDSFQVVGGDVRFHCPVSRPPYTAPELIGTNFSTTWREPSSDAFALAVIIYQLLLHDHPYDNAILAEEPELEVAARIHRGLYPHAAAALKGLQPGPYRPAPSQISAAVDGAFRCSFGALPALRPTAAEWVLLLRELHGLVVPCSSNKRHQHVQGMECLWCSLESRVGQPLCRYSPLPAKLLPQPAAIGLECGENQPPGLELVRNQLGLAKDLVIRRALLAEQLLQLEPVLAEVAAKCSSPDQLINETEVMARLSSWRHRLSRWLGAHQKVDVRQKCAEELIYWANATAAESHQRGQELELRRLEVLGRLAGSKIAKLATLLPLHDPSRSAELLWQRAEDMRRQNWLQQQLAGQSLRSWRIEGFGESRMALLQQHGLERGDQLLAQIDRLQSLSGIGQALQRKLRHHLESEIALIQSMQPVVSVQASIDSVISVSSLEMIEQLHDEINMLQSQAVAVAIESQQFNQTINQWLQQRDSLLVSYKKLF